MTDKQKDNPANGEQAGNESLTIWLPPATLASLNLLVLARSSAKGVKSKAAVVRDLIDAAARKELKR